MTAKRQPSLDQEIAVLSRLVEQYREDYALPQTEADILVSCSEETKRLFVAKETDAGRAYVQQCHGYYSAEQRDGFFNDAETGRKIFTEIATQYLRIFEMVKA